MSAIRQISFFDGLFGTVSGLNEVVAHDPPGPPYCHDAERDFWLCPRCYPNEERQRGGLRTGLAHRGGGNLAYCWSCGYRALFRLTLHHTGWRRAIAPDVLARQAEQFHTRVDEEGEN